MEECQLCEICEKREDHGGELTRVDASDVEFEMSDQVMNVGILHQPSCLLIICHHGMPMHISRRSITTDVISREYQLLAAKEDRPDQLIHPSIYFGGAENPTLRSGGM